MSEAKFTKGPWRVEVGTTVVWGACNPDDISSYGMGYPVTDCRITPVSNSIWCQGPEYEEGYANANLIAAAPDLYEALERILPMAEDDVFQYGEDCDEDEDIIFAREALSKARGETE